jgi:hypothetical protein
VVEATMLGRRLEQNKLIVGKPLIVYFYAAVQQIEARMAATLRR